MLLFFPAIPETEPLSGCSRPNSRFSSVVFPQPEGPMMQVVSPSGKEQELSLIHICAMDFLNMMKRWNDNGYFTKSALSDTDSQKVQTGKAACTIHNIDTYESRAIDKPEWNFKFANFVQDVSNLPFTQDALVISNTAENPERALALYDLITSDEAVSYTHLPAAFKGCRKAFLLQ